MTNSLQRPPQISAVLATYNRAHCLEKSIQSVIDQTISNYELIVVDDGSDDDTETVVRKLSVAGVRYIRLPQNTGRSAATNHGARVARGEWLLFVDSDDRCCSDRFERQLRAATLAESTTVDGVFGRTAFVDEHGRRTEHYPPVGRRLTGRTQLADVLHYKLVGAGSLLVRRAAFLGIGGFDEQIRKSEDRDFAIRFVQRFTLVGMDDVVCEIVRSPDSLTEQPLPDSLRRTLTKNADAYRTLDRKTLAGMYCDVGKEYLVIGRQADAADMFRICLKLHPNVAHGKHYASTKDQWWSRILAMAYARWLKIRRKFSPAASKYLL